MGKKIVNGSLDLNQFTFYTVNVINDIKSHLALAEKQRGSLRSSLYSFMPTFLNIVFLCLVWVLNVKRARPVQPILVCVAHTLHVLHALA